MFDENVCTKCEGFNQKSWDSCGSCSFDNDGTPLDCLSCTEESNKQLIAHAGAVYPKHQCGYVLPSNCLELRAEPGREHECYRCKSGFFLYEELNECWSCSDIEKGGVEQCSICDKYEVINDIPIVSCEQCSTPFIKTYVKSDPIHEVSRTVCDWSMRSRPKNCKLTDLSDHTNCFECFEGFFYDVD